MRCLYFQRLFYVFLCSSAKMAFVGFRWALQRLPPCAADCDSYSPARFRPSACRPHSASGRLDELSDFAVGLRCAAAADGDAAAHGRARAEPSDVGFAAAHAAPFVRHEGDEGLAREVVCCEEGRDGRCDGRPPAGRTDVDHVVSPGVGQVGFQRRTVDGLRRFLPFLPLGTVGRTAGCAMRQLMFLYLLGVQPTTFLKSLVKCAGYLNPSS